MSDTARRHHTVSRFYLDGFADKKRKGRLLVMDAVTRKHFRTDPINVAVERDFNRIELEGIDPGALERDFASFEGEVAGAIARMKEIRDFASDADRGLIIYFITLLIIRNPYFRGRMAEFQEDVMKRTLQVMTSSEKVWNAQRQKMIADGYLPATNNDSYESFRDFVRRDQYDVRLRREWYIGQEMQLMQKMPEYLARRNWVVLRASADSGGFLTSDHPVSLMWSDPKMNDDFYGPGLGLRGTTVTFPVSPEIGLVGAFEVEAGTRDVGSDAVAIFNGGTILSAARQVYACDENASYLLQADRKPKRCMELLADTRFAPAKRPKRPWY